MPETYKILGQVAPSDTTEQILYTTPAGTQTLVTNITAVNRTNSTQTFDVSVHATAPNVASVPYPLVAVAGKGGSAGTTAAYSTDGTTWTTTTLPVSASWTGVTFGNNLYVAIATGFNYAASSTNGITWTQRTLSMPDFWETIHYNSNSSRFVALSSGTPANHSTDGISWTSAYVPAGNFSTNNNITSSAFGNNMSVGVATGASSASTTKAVSSTDGLTWVERTMPALGIWRSVAFGNGVFSSVSSGPSTTAASSTDGITWTLRTLPASANWWGVAFGNGVFVAISQSSTTAASSADGITWTLRTLPTSAAFRSITFGSGVFSTVVANSSTAASSTDGITWTTRTLPTSNSWYTVAGTTSVNNYVSPAINNLYKNSTIQSNASEILEPGIVLGAGNTIVVKGTANTTFSTYGVEIS